MSRAQAREQLGERATPRDARAAVQRPPVEKLAAAVGNRAFSALVGRGAVVQRDPQTQTKAPADPAADAKALSAQSPSTNAEYATWILKAHELGFVLYNETFKPGDDLVAIRDGQTVKGVDPTKKTLGALHVVYDLARGPLDRWIAKPSEPKQSITIGSFLRENQPPHTGGAIDLNQLAVATTVDKALTLLGDLSVGKYGIGFPFQGDFFPAASEISAQQSAASKAAKAGAAPAAVTGALVKWDAHTHKSSWDAAAGAWSATQVDEVGGAWKLLKSQALRDAIKDMRKAGCELVIFPDNPEHVHIDLR
jgi:hypothetical protein